MILGKWVNRIHPASARPKQFKFLSTGAAPVALLSAALCGPVRSARRKPGKPPLKQGREAATRQPPVRPEFQGCSWRLGASVAPFRSSLAFASRPRPFAAAFLRCLATPRPASAPHQATSPRPSCRGGQRDARALPRVRLGESALGPVESWSVSLRTIVSTSSCRATRCFSGGAPSSSRSTTTRIARASAAAGDTRARSA